MPDLHDCEYCGPIGGRNCFIECVCECHDSEPKDTDT